jgi:hypothetical protein
MSLKENLKAKIKLGRPLDSGHGLWPWAFARDGVPREGKSSRGRPERSAAKSKGDEVGAPGSARGDPLFQSLVSTTREPPGRRWLDKGLTKELLAMTDFEHKKVKDLHLYIRPMEGDTTEVAVLDNELPIYHTTVDDVTLRKSPYWQQMFSIRNVRKIMNDHDVISSKGKESLKRLHASALALLDLTYTRDDLGLLLEDARRGLEQKSISQIQESLDLFLELLGFQPVSLEMLAPRFQSFARPKLNGGVVPSFEHLVLFNEENLRLGLKKGTFSPKNDLDLAWVLQRARGEERADLQDTEVFEFLAELAAVKAQTQRV